MFTHYELMLLQAIERERGPERAAPPRRRRVAVPRWVRLAGRRAERAAREAQVHEAAQAPVQAPGTGRTVARAPASPAARMPDPAPAGGRENHTANARAAGTLAACAASGGRIR